MELAGEWLDGFGNQRLTLTQLWWEQYFNRQNLGFRLGKFDPLDFLDTNDYRSANSYFLNAGFSSTPGLNAASHGVGLVAGTRFKGFYLLADLHDMDAVKTHVTISRYFQGGPYYKAIEFGYGKVKNKHWQPNYHLTLWRADQQTSPSGKPSNKGVSLSFLYPFAYGITPFFATAMLSLKVR